MEMYPALDEKFVMGVKTVGKVLFRQVSEKNHMEIGLAGELINEMIRWGVRRQVMFNTIFVHGEEEEPKGQLDDVDYGGYEEEEEEVVEDDNLERS
ncbi:hypothetical protein L2E82_08001 [Cichorium intybus]|uniref:Uncharacterized protein n=1 Tax=Cichorium intybus TaxID=13427 RepID=A0ACB9G5D7_CICIN|nr:hypothetical protein L2E82_08001 [Cichorium intybus]